MKSHAEKVAETILLKLHERSGLHRGLTWSFESAFAAVGYQEAEVDREKILSLFVARGWIDADQGYPPYDVLLGIDGPDLSGDTAVRLTSRGEDAAISLIEKSRPKSIGERLAGIPRSDWIALIALIVSLIALKN